MSGDESDHMDSATRLLLSPLFSLSFYFSSMEAKLCLSCTLCHAAIQPGMRIWPTGGGDGSGGRFLWVHLSCAAEAGIDTARPPPCKHYARGACVMADRCFFAHDQVGPWPIAFQVLPPA
jgi:hypothetical protein